jgi:hypothetical protein
MLIFRTKAVARFTRQEGIDDARLKEAIERAESGLIDADLGGGLIKQRVARPGKGKSGGFRMIVAYKAQDRAVFLYGFAKNDRDNISQDQLQTLRAIGASWLSAPSETIRRAIDAGDLQEIDP